MPWRITPTTASAIMAQCARTGPSSPIRTSRWLRAAERVTAIRIGADDDAGLGMTRLLSELGARPEVHTVAAQGADLGAQIVAEAKTVGADLLVAGAYRHAQMIEWLMGGTTRHLLAAADIPLLMTH